MNDLLRDLPDLAVNPDWARLPLFDRKGWRELPFGEFAENVNERVEPTEAGDTPYVGLEHIEPQDLHIRTWGGASDVIGTKLRFRKGDVIFGRRRAYQRKLAVAEFDGICSAHAMVLRAKPSRMLPEFLPFLMMSETFMRRAVQISVGSLSPTVNWTSLRHEGFTIPTLEKQRALATILTSGDSAVSRVGLVQVRAASLGALSLGSLLEGLSAPRVRVGDLTHFSSGKAVAVTALARSPALGCSVPVYGGNGIAGYTDTPLVDEPTIAIGRVGQFCGSVFRTSGPSWITDNALMAGQIVGVSLDFLGLCLEAADINRRKIGNYLPLINQKVVHDMLIPLPDPRQQHQIVRQAGLERERVDMLGAHLKRTREFVNMLRDLVLR